MKLRYFTDDYVYYSIIGVDDGCGHLREFTNILEKDRVHKSLTDCITYILQNISLQKEINDLYNLSVEKSKSLSYKVDMYNNFFILISMNEISSKRSSKPDNILHYCESALFKFNKNMVCRYSIFNFRKTIDPLLEYATLYENGDNVLYYSDKTVIAGQYFKEITTDKELAEFVLNNQKSIIF